MSSPSEAGAPYFNAAGYTYTGVTPSRPASAAAGARGRTLGGSNSEPAQSPTLRRPSSAGPASAQWAMPGGSGSGLGFEELGSPAGRAGTTSGGAVLSSAEGFPRSFQLVRSGSNDSLASLVCPPLQRRRLLCCALSACLVLVPLLR